MKSHSRRERAASGTALDRSKEKFREWQDAIDEHGAFMTRAMAAAAIGVSRQRVHQLICKGRLATVRIGDRRYVPLAELEEFCATRLPSGRPRKSAPRCEVRAA